MPKDPKIGRGVVPNSKSLVRCLSCGVTFPKPIKCIKLHCLGRKHVANDSLMQSHGIRFTGKALYCKACKETLDRRDTVLSHIAEEAHYEWINTMDKITSGESVNYNDYLTTESEYASCEVCNIEFDCSITEVQKHIYSKRHREHLEASFKIRNGMISIRNNKLWCKMCAVQIDDDLNVLVDHVTEAAGHTQWCSKVEELIQDQGIDIEGFLTIQDEKYAYCKRCDVKIACTITRIECHIHTECHELRIIPA